MTAWKSRSRRLAMSLGVAVALGATAFGATRADGDRGDGNRGDGGRGEHDRLDWRAAKGLVIAPVRLDLRGKSRQQVGTGSYLVNAVAGCNDCHTWPNYAAGGDPYLGQRMKINAAHYLAGGRPFGPGLVSPNITPDAHGKPGGMTWHQFESAIRMGHDPDGSGRILQVMPWPAYSNMLDQDLEAIYAYLMAIPHAEPAGP